LGACASADRIAANPAVDTDWSADDYKYRINAGDELGIRFPINPDLNAQVTVGPDGRGVFPLVSGLKVSGLTVEELNATLTKAYAAILRAPILETAIYNYVSGQVFVGGEVKLPGARAVRGPLTVAQAINEAGGFQDTSRQDKVILLRHRKNGHVLLKVVDIKALYAGKTDEDVRVLPGDVVFVPRSQISEVDRIVHQYLTNIVPFNATYNINSKPY
jgi:protein involved in polysaccharide export with SLBB domain